MTLGSLYDIEVVKFLRCTNVHFISFSNNYGSWTGGVEIDDAANMATPTVRWSDGYDVLLQTGRGTRPLHGVAVVATSSAICPAA